MRELIGLSIFVLAVYGLTNAIAILKIGRFLFGVGQCNEEGCPELKHPLDKRKFLGRLPWLGDLFYCPPCVAFWIGMLASKMLFSPAATFVAIPGMAWRGTIVDGLAASGAVWLLYTWTEKNIVGTSID
jgi:hypothetical protein